MELSQLFDQINRDVGFWVWPAGIIGLTVLFILAMWMGAALAGIESLTFVRAAMLAPLQMIVILPLGLALFYFLAGSDVSNWGSTTNVLVYGGLTLGLDLALVFLLLLVLRQGHPLQVLFLWMVRLPVLALLGSLVVGAVFVVMAIVQALQDPKGGYWLAWIGGAFGIVIALALVLFFATRMGDSQVTRPRGTTR